MWRVLTCSLCIGTLHRPSVHSSLPDKIWCEKKREREEKTIQKHMLWLFVQTECRLLGARHTHTHVKMLISQVTPVICQTRRINLQCARNFCVRMGYFYPRFRSAIYVDARQRAPNFRDSIKFSGSPPLPSLSCSLRCWCVTRPWHTLSTAYTFHKIYAIVITVVVVVIVALAFTVRVHSPMSNTVSQWCSIK